MALQEFAPVGAMLFFSVLIALIVLVISRIFGPHRPTFRKNAPYESGMKPIGAGTRRVSIKFYLTAVLFIIFDVEIVFFLPWAVVSRELAGYGLAIMGFFTFILIVGFIYEWKKGGMEWE